MIGKEIYKIYAPEISKWSRWVRPVPFAAIDIYNRKMMVNWQDRKVIFLNNYEKDIAIFVDLPGKESIELGVGLAKMGYRPIPLFNGTDEPVGASAILDTDLIENSLINGSEKLKYIQLKDDANPAFLLDRNRTNRYRSNESIFDNSWDLYKQDIPTADFFKFNGIYKLIVVGDVIQSDLRKIFFEFQAAGMEIYLTDGYLPAKKVILKKIIKERLEKKEL